MVLLAHDFCVEIIEQTHTYAAAFKPNSAFFEQFGSEGMSALEKVCFGVVITTDHFLKKRSGKTHTHRSDKTQKQDLVLPCLVLSLLCSLVWGYPALSCVALC
jgi:hypothetical protein